MVVLLVEGGLGGGILGDELHVGGVLRVHEQGIELLEARLHVGNLPLTLVDSLLHTADLLLLLLMGEVVILRRLRPLGTLACFRSLGSRGRSGRRCGRCGSLHDGLRLHRGDVVTLLQTAEPFVDTAEMLADLAAAKLIDLADKAVEEVTVVADDDSGAVEGLHSLLEDVLGRHVEVVGGLVEDKEVDGGEQQAYHCQARPLTTGEDTDLLLGDLTTEHEGTQQVVDLQPHLTARHLVDGVVDGEVLVEELGLVLGEIAYLHVMAYLQLPGERYLAHDTFHERGLTLAVLTHEGDLLTALDGHVDTGEDDVVAIGFLHTVADDGVVAGAQTRRELQVHDLVVDIVDLHGDDLLQLPDLLLHLYGFCRLVAEALDEGLGVGNLLLLVLPGADLLLAALLAELHIFVVLDFVVLDMSARYLQGAVGDVVDERPVMADEYEGCGALLDKLLQPLDGLDVEVVGGLVEEEDVGLAEQYLRQLDAHAPATGELPRGAVEIGALEAQARQRALHLGLILLATHHLEAFLLLGEAGDELHVAVALVVGALSHLLLHTAQLSLNLRPTGKGLAGLLQDGGVVGELHDLWQIAYLAVVRDGDGTGGGMKKSAEHLQHRRLPGAVLAHEGDAVVVVDDEADIVEERLGAELYGEVVYRNHVLFILTYRTIPSVLPWGCRG